MTELLLLRHGKAYRDESIEDAARPLKDRGKRDAQRVGAWLAQQGIEPDLVVTSPAERALVTAEKCCKAMGRGVAGLRREPGLYGADLDDLVALVGACAPGVRRLMLVGHNPGLELLLRHLVGDAVTDAGARLMPTAGLAHLAFDGDWRSLQAKGARLLDLRHPRQLPDGFPYPDRHGSERRERPAYYYRQSAVVPYRVSTAGLEFLIVRSSRRRHWVVPKGIIEPGFSPQLSAEKEALEEAGVEGRVLADAIGEYRYPKWGAECAVSVYPMRVDRELADDEWRESHRGRQWVSPETAASLLKQVELRDIVMALAQSLARSNDS
ncbi:MAG: histidine phosphatase family protein [Gammaproteobacteria bacterium]|nr:histidine phosphatase family protein [Gammaproteobacteria bacterium]